MSLIKIEGTHGAGISEISNTMTRVVHMMTFLGICSSIYFTFFLLFLKPVKYIVWINHGVVVC